MAMVSYPDVLMKAQKEIDSVVGTDRLPTIADRESLPYSERRHSNNLPLELMSISPGSSM
jgi:hypothetical protein